MLMEVKSWPVQAMCDKAAKNHAWQVTKMAFDHKNKRMVCEAIAGSDKVAQHELSYEDLCKEFSWKSFKLSDNGQSVIPVVDVDVFYAFSSKCKTAKAEGKGTSSKRKSKKVEDEV